MHKRAAAIALFAAFSASCCLTSGCAKATTADHDPKFAALYAELMLQHEQDKAKDHVSDSLYQAHARGILSSHGMSEDDFKKRSAELMKNDETWRAFLADVSQTFDSLKIAREKPQK